MLGHRAMAIEDYLGILKRRFWIILVSAVTFFGVGLGLSRVIPPQYLSQTLVIVQQQKVPEDYVKPVISEDLNGRLASMREQIMSRSLLEPIIERFSLFASGNPPMESRVEMTRKAISIDAIQSGAKIPGFYISFKASNPRIAQQVCTEITSLFVSESLSAREQSAEGTTAFLSQQLADAKRNLDDMDAKLAAFQQKYIGRLPGQEATNSNALQAVTSRLDAATQSLNRMQQDETFLEAVVSQQQGELQRTEPSSGVTSDALQTQLRSLIAQKQELQTHYTADYPDVVAVNRKIKEVQAQIAQAASHPAPPAQASSAVRSSDPPQLQQAKAQLRSVQQSIAAQKAEQARLEQQVKLYQGRIESSPEVEEEYKQLTRDHDTALGFYKDLLSKMNESSMATNLERRQQGEQFQVLDAANLPAQPTFPNPVVFAGGGFALGLVFGLAISALLEYRDTAVRDERDIYAFTKLPTLACISYVDGLPAPRTQRKHWWSFSRMKKPLEGVNG